MKTGWRHVLRALVAAVVVASIAAPVTQAGHKEYGVRCALALSQHRADAGTVCRKFAKALGNHRREIATPSVTVVQPSGFDWGDAGVGAVGAMGLVALAAGALMTTRHGTRASA